MLTKCRQLVKSLVGGEISAFGLTMCWRLGIKSSLLQSTKTARIARLSRLNRLNPVVPVLSTPTLLMPKMYGPTKPPMFAVVVKMGIEMGWMEVGMTWLKRANIGETKAGLTQLPICKSKRMDHNGSHDWREDAANKQAQVTPAQTTIAFHLLPPSVLVLKATIRNIPNGAALTTSIATCSAESVGNSSSTTLGNQNMSP